LRDPPARERSRRVLDLSSDKRRDWSEVPIGRDRVDEVEPEALQRLAPYRIVENLDLINQDTAGEADRRLVLVHWSAAATDPDAYPLGDKLAPERCPLIVGREEGLIRLAREEADRHFPTLVGRLDL
jgi:hypothetical protein